MNRLGKRVLNECFSFTRTSGDEPEIRKETGCVVLFYPYKRG